MIAYNCYYIDTKLMNFKVSDLAPSSNECTEILLKLPTEAEKNRFPPIRLASTLHCSQSPFQHISFRGRRGYRPWIVCSFSRSLPNDD